jgi:tRNA(Arg) A34 adenosine deaminase TadA
VLALMNLPRFPACDVEALMREAIREAEAAAAAGELPIGAVVAIDGGVVGRGRSRQVERRSQLAHAELDALLAGGELIWTRHDETVLFTTVEPCPMCLGATVMADVPHIVFACPDANAGVPAMLEIPYVQRHIATYRGGVLEAEARAVIEGAHAPLLGYLDG